MVVCTLLLAPRCLEFLALSRSAAVNEHPRFGRANRQKVEAYVMLLRLRHDLYLKWKNTGKWPDDKEANEALGAHSKYWGKQLQNGHAILAGYASDYWDNVALVVFEADSENEAQEIAQNDPAVQTYVFQAQIRHFDVHFLSNIYLLESNKHE